MKSVFIAVALALLAQSAQAKIICQSDSSVKGTRTAITLIESDIPGRYDLKFTQTEGSIGAGYMAGHGGLGISGDGAPRELWLYTGYGKGRAGDSKQGALTYSRLKFDQEAVQCDYDDNLRFPDALPKKISCTGVGSNLKVTTEFPSTDWTSTNTMTIALDTEDARFTVTDLEMGTKLYAHMGRLTPSSKWYYYLFIAIGSAGRGEAALNLPGSDQISVKVPCVDDSIAAQAR